jgi:hypothetical protein
MKVLVACEESQAVCKAFRQKGHEAYSCDIIDCSGGHPEWHIKQDVLPLLNGRCDFRTMDGEAHSIVGKWDLIIAHPPCTYLTVAANKLYNVEKYGEKAIKRIKDREDAIQFFMAFVNADCDKKAIENPIGVISTRYRKPDQIIQPYHFGHPVRKSTCLWLYNLPELTPTNIVDFECIHSKGASGGYSGASWVVRDEYGKILPYKDPRVSRIRSKTYEGIAKAMAEQWGIYGTKTRSEWLDELLGGAL